VFITESSATQFDDFKQYAFELKTIAMQNLAPKRLQEYLEIIYKDGGGLPTVQAVMDYVVVVMGKYLQIMVAYNIHKEESAQVTALFEQFNVNYQSLETIFVEITGIKYNPGIKNEIQKPIARVFPLSKGVKEDTSQALTMNDLHDFLAKHDLIRLEEFFNKKDITFDDVLEMDMEEMELVGIKPYKNRKFLWKAIQDHLAGVQTVQTDSVPRQEAPLQGAPRMPINKEVDRRQMQDSVPVYPPTLTVSSDQGPAGEEQWDTMGEYTRSVEDHDNKPVFW